MSKANITKFEEEYKSIKDAILKKGYIPTNRKGKIDYSEKSLFKGQKAFLARLLNDREFFLKLVEKDGKQLRHASTEINNDKKVVLLAIEDNPQALQYASNILKSRREVIIKAINSDPTTLEHVSKADDGIISAAFEKNKQILQYAPRNYVMNIVKDKGYLLQYASKEHKNDRKIVSTAVSNYGPALQYASGSLRDDIVIVAKAYSNNRSSLQHASRRINHEVGSKYLSNYIKNELLELKNIFNNWDDVSYVMENGKEVASPGKLFSLLEAAETLYVAKDFKEMKEKLGLSDDVLERIIEEGVQEYLPDKVEEKKKNIIKSFDQEPELSSKPNPSPKSVVGIGMGKSKTSNNLSNLG